jgi:Flp pilus assembly pilin Flp
MRILKRIAVFLREENLGQGLAEYCLITAFIALAALGIFLHVSGGLQGVWTTTNNVLSAGNNTNQGGGVVGQ